MEKNKKISTLSKDFGERFRFLREQAGISQTQLSEKLGYKTSGSISNIESGRSHVDSRVLFELAKHIPIDLHWLITGEIYNPQKRIEAQFRESYSNLLKEHQEAQAAVKRLESKQQGGQPLTPQEEQELLSSRGRVRITIRQMENLTEYTRQNMQGL